jgi:hypothetical protein
MTLLIASLVSIVLFLAFLLWMRWETRTMGDMLDAFVRRFPGRCPVCSFHYYSIRECLLRPDEPVPFHKCLEDKDD